MNKRGPRKASTYRANRRNAERQRRAAELAAKRASLAPLPTNREVRAG